MRARTGVLVRESARTRSGPGTARRAAAARPQGRVTSMRAWRLPLLPHREVDSLQDSSSLISNLDMPCSLGVCRDRLAAPGSPWRSANCQRHVTDLIVAVEPDVVQRLAGPARHAHPQHDGADAVGEGRAGILWRAIDHRPSQYG